MIGEGGGSDGARLRTALDAVPVMVGYWDADLRNHVVSAAYREWFAPGPDPQPSDHVRDLLGEVVHAADVPALRAVLRGSPQHVRGTAVDAAGATRHARTSYLPAVTDDGTVAGFHVLVTDVTDAVRTEQALVHEQEHARELMGRLVTLSRTTAALRHLDPATVRGAVCDAALSLGYDGACLAALDPRTGAIRSVVGRGLLDPAPAPAPARPLPDTATLTHQVVTTRERVVVAADQGRCTPPEAGTHTAAALPVVLGADVIAVLHAVSPGPPGAGAVDLEALELLAALAATALDDAEQHQNTRAERALSTVEAAQLGCALRSRAAIEQAKGILMAVHQVDAATAFALLKDQSQRENVKLAVIAADFVEAQSGHPVERPPTGGTRPAPSEP